MTIFLVWRGDGFDNFELQGAFSTEEKACQKIVSLRKDTPQHYFFFIGEITVE